MARLAIVCRDAGGFGGISRHVVEHASGFIKAGWEVTVVAERFDRDALEAVGARCASIWGWPWGSWLKRRWFASRADAHVGGFDLVHGHGDNFRHDVMSLHNCVAAAAEAISGASWTAPSAVERLHAAQLRAHRFKALICNSQQTSDEVQRRYKVPKEKTTVIYPGYDPRRFKFADRAKLRALERAQLGWGTNQLVIGLVTSGDFAKRGVSTFLDALGILQRAGVRFKALVVGKEKKLGPYLLKASELGLKDTVRFLPPRADVERYYHALDIYVHPAHYEEFGQSVEEALACGLPVVVGKNVGASELLDGEMRDFIVDPRAEEFASAIEKIAEFEDLRGRLSEMGPACAAPNTWEGNVAATLAVYRRLLSAVEQKR